MPRVYHRFVPIDPAPFIAGRKKRRQSRADLARATGIPLHRLERMELGEMTNPYVDDVMILSTYLSLDPTELLIHPTRGKPWLTRLQYKVTPR